MTDQVLENQILEILDDHHCIVTDELGKRCIKDLVSLIAQREAEAYKQGYIAGGIDQINNAVK